MYMLFIMSQAVSSPSPSPSSSNVPPQVYMWVAMQQDSATSHTQPHFPVHSRSGSLYGKGTGYQYLASMLMFILKSV